jgi:hypothetical protein
MEEKEQLMQEITSSIQEVSEQKEFNKLNSLSRFAPERVAKMLYLYATGSSQTRLVKKYGFDRHTVISVLTDYADHIGKFRELSGKIAAKNYLDMSSLEEDLIEVVRDRLESGELEATFRDLKANAAREALTARGEATNITEDRKVYTQEDYEATAKAAEDRIRKLKEAEVINVD